MMEDDFDFIAWVPRLLIGGLIIGAIVLSWVYILGPLFNQADYNIFNTSPQHVGAVAQRFSDDCRQLAETNDPVARKAIEQDIYQVASTVDLAQVQMPGYIRSCVTKAIHDVGGN